MTRSRCLSLITNTQSHLLQFEHVLFKHVSFCFWLTPQYRLAGVYVATFSNPNKWHNAADCSIIRRIFYSTDISIEQVQSKAKEKPKQNRLSLEDKVEILKKLDEGVNGNRLALDFNVSKSAISQIKKQKEQIFEAVSKSDQEFKKKTLHKAEYAELEAKLYGWFLKQRERTHREI